MGERPKHISNKLDLSYDAVRKICSGKNYKDITSQYVLSTPCQPSLLCPIEKVFEIKEVLVQKSKNEIDKSYKEIANNFEISKSTLRNIRKWLLEVNLVDSPV